MTRPAAAVHGDRPAVAGLAATMTVVAMGLGYSITAADPTILSANISEIHAGLHMSPSTGSFVASLATLTLAAAVLGIGTALLTQDAMRRFAGFDISLAEAREAFRVAHGTSVASTEERISLTRNAPGRWSRAQPPASWTRSTPSAS